MIFIQSDRRDNARISGQITSNFLAYMVDIMVEMVIMVKLVILIEMIITV